MRARGFIAIFLAVALLTSAMFSMIGISADEIPTYTIGAIDYFERGVNVLGNFPDTEYLSYNDEWQNSKPEYKDVMPAFPKWEEIDLKWSEVIQALKGFMNNLITYVRHFFVNLGNVFPNLWFNIKEALSHWFTPVRVTLVNVGSFFKTFFTARDWFVCIGLALIPCDWEEIVKEYPDIKVPLFGHVRDYPIDDYFGG